jgi:hypothetical protein
MDTSGPPSSNLLKLANFLVHLIFLSKLVQIYKCYIQFDSAKSALQNSIQGFIESSLLLVKKVKIQNFTVNFRTKCFRYLGQKGTIFEAVQENKNRFWKPVKNCISWYINRRKRMARFKKFSIQTWLLNIFYSTKSQFLKYLSDFSLAKCCKKWNSTSHSCWASKPE